MARYFQISAGWVMAMLVAGVAAVGVAYVSMNGGPGGKFVWALLEVVVFAIAQITIVMITATPADNGPRTLGPIYGATATGLGLTLLVIGAPVAISAASTRSPTTMIIAAGLILTPIASAVMSVARARRLIAQFRDRDSRVCPKCDYSREGLAADAACPECGGPPPAGAGLPGSSSLHQAAAGRS